MEQNFAGPRGRAGEVIWIVPLEDGVERPGWEEGREELGNRLFWEAQEQDSLKGLDSPQARWEKEPGPWEDTKAFLVSFEQVAQACHWPREEWVARLLPALSGEAQRAFGSLEARDREDYGKVKAAILRWEANRMETQRQHFRQFCSREVEDPRQIYRHLQELCHRWLRPERHSKEQILDLLILEQFLASLPPELQSWIRAGSPENCTQAAALAEDFLLSQQGVSETRKWQRVHLGCLGLQETFLDPAEVQSYKEAEQAEISLPTGSGTQQCSHSSSSLLSERQERVEAGQMEAVKMLEETGVSLQRMEQHLTQDQGQRTKFWQVLPDSSVEKGSPFKVKNPSCGGNKLGDPEKTPGDLLVTPEIQVEICESKGEWRKKSLQRQNESQGLSEGLGAVGSQTHPEHQRKEKPLFSRYGRRYSLTSRLVTEITKKDLDECSQSEENSDLDEPQRISTGEKSYKCPIRGSFPEGVNLMRNQSGHKGERKYYCPETGNSFTPQTLARPLKIHQQQTTYTCPVCGQSMKWKHDLNRHLRVHTGEKPFKCPECGLRFYRRDNWLRHQRGHGRKMPYECPECGKDFRRRSLMVKHQRIHK